jgi:hypothetical protein
MFLSATPRTPAERVVKAIIDGDLLKVTQLIPRVIAVSERLINPGGKQPLHLACERGQVAIVEKLIELGAEVNAVTDRDFTPLHAAAQAGHIEIVLILLKAGASLAAVTDQGMGTTPLQEAAHHGLSGVCTLLIMAGAEAGYEDRRYHLTAEGLARLAGHDDTVIALQGYQHAFITRVRNEIVRYRSFFNENTSADLYCKELDQIPFDGVEADDYFRLLKTGLNKNYEEVKADVQSLRLAIIQYMKQYNSDKLLKQRVDETLPSVLVRMQFT